MPSHQERREPLPKGYQFGDAAAVHAEIASRRAGCKHGIFISDHDGVWCVNCGMTKEEITHGLR